MNAKQSKPIKSSWKKDWARNKQIYILFIPVLIYYIIFHYVPMAGIAVAFTNYKPALGLLKSKFVGLNNFRRFFRSPFGANVIRNSIVLNLLLLLWCFPAPIILAILFNEMNAGRYKKFLQTVSYMPHFISTVVIASLVTMFVNSEGLITTILNSLGIVPKKDLLMDKSYFRTIYVASDLWETIGWGSIIYIATLSGVDVELYEAAEVDGANRLQKIRLITLPTLLPIIVVQLIMRIGSMMSLGAGKVLLLYRPSTYEVSDIISSYVYRIGLVKQDYGLATAVDLFNSIVNIILLTFANYFSRKLTDESLW